MENKDTPQENTTQQTAQPAEPKTQHVAKPTTAEKVKQNKKNKTKSTITNYVVLAIIGFGIYWLVTQYFHIGDKNYTEAAQVEEFINPINTRVSGYIKEI